MSVFGMMVQGLPLAEASGAAPHIMFLKDYHVSQMRDNPRI